MALRTQAAFAKEAKKCKVSLPPLHPRLVDMSRIDKFTILRLAEEFQAKKEDYTREMQQILYTKLHEELSLNLNANDIQNLMENGVKIYHCLFSLMPKSTFNQTISTILHMGFSKKFLEFQLNPPQKECDWGFYFPVPKNQKEFAELKDFEINWLQNHFLHAKRDWESLNFICQAAYTERMNDKNNFRYLTAIPSIEEMTLDIITPHVAYILLKGYRWQDGEWYTEFTFKAQTVFNGLLRQYGQEELPITTTP